MSALSVPFSHSVSAQTRSQPVDRNTDDQAKFSKKMFDTVYTSVAPLVEQDYKHKLRIVFRPIIQPWHPSSTLVHEAAVAVLQTSPDKFWVRGTQIQRLKLVRSES